VSLQAQRLRVDIAPRRRVEHKNVQNFTTKLKQKETEARSSLFAITSLISLFALFSGVL
jgi:hypothetical protein